MSLQAAALGVRSGVDAVMARVLFLWVGDGPRPQLGFLFVGKRAQRKRVAKDEHPAGNVGISGGKLPHGVCALSVWDKVRESDQAGIRLIACVHADGTVLTSTQIRGGAQIPPPAILNELLQAVGADTLREARERGLVRTN